MHTVYRHNDRHSTRSTCISHLVIWGMIYHQILFILLPHLWSLYDPSWIPPDNTYGRRTVQCGYMDVAVIPAFCRLLCMFFWPYGCCAEESKWFQMSVQDGNIIRIECKVHVRNGDENHETMEHGMSNKSTIIRVLQHYDLVLSCWFGIQRWVVTDHWSVELWVIIGCYLDFYYSFVISWCTYSEQVLDTIIYKVLLCWALWVGWPQQVTSLAVGVRRTGSTNALWKHLGSHCQLQVCDPQNMVWPPHQWKPWESSTTQLVMDINY